MPTLDFDPANKTETALDFPRLRLETGEKARILCIEPAPTYAYVHTLRAPKIVAGVAERRTVSRKDGSSFVDVVKEFIGRPLCLGDLGILTDKGTDPKNCPACARSLETNEVEPAQRRFAMHVIQYGCRPNSWDPRAPFTCDVVIWGFTQMMFNKLADIQGSWGPLKNHDLLLGPCTDKTFQKFEIMVAPEALWQKDERLKQQVLDTYRENRAPDLHAMCGRQVERRWMEDDIERIAQRWRIANNQPEDGTEAVGRGSLAQPTESLAAQPTPAATESVDLAALLGAAPPEAVKAREEAAEVAPMNFDALLDSLS